MYFRRFVGREVCTDRAGRVVYDVPVEFVKSSVRQPRPRVSSRYAFERKQRAINEEYKALCVLERLSLPVSLHREVVKRIQVICSECGLRGYGGSV